MLFDLRGRGRRRTVQVIYLGLAVLIGLGLVGFGIGGGFGGGGLLNAVGNNGGGSTSFDSRIKADVRLTRQQPNNPQGWATLIQDDFRQAGTGANYDSTSANGGQFTPAAHAVLSQAADAWQHYIALTPHPATDVAREMVEVFSGPGALNQPGATVGALEVLIASDPTNQQLYVALAQAAYQAGNKRQGDLAAAKAVSLAPAAQQTALRQELAALKANPNGTATPTSAASSSSGPPVVNLPSTSTTSTSAASAHTHKK